VNDRGPFGRAQDLALSDEAARELDLRGIQSVDARIVPGG
jgi:rare lipoprotein A (peptidoglycan hydrolase)